MKDLSLKLTWKISLKKILIWGFWAKNGQNGPKILKFLYTQKIVIILKYFKFYGKSIHGVFLIFFKLQELDGLKFTQMIFFAENLLLKFLVKRGAKLVFSSWCIEFSGFFAWSYCSIKAGNWITFFLNNFCFEIFSIEIF